MRRTYYYTDKLKDDFANTKGVKNRKKIDGTYKYRHNNIFYKIGSFVLFRLFATPIGWLYCKLKLGRKVVNKRAIKGLKGFFLYGNHTQTAYDSFNPSLVSFPRKTKMIANADSVSIPVIGALTPMLGAMPLPDDIAATKNFLAEMKRAATNGEVVIIYPEAHIWPYYNEIRPFVDASFAYPIKFGVPTVAMVTVYRQRKVFKNLPPKCTVYISDPIYPEQYTDKHELRQKVYDFMTETIAKHGSVAYHTYLDKNAQAEATNDIDNTAANSDKVDNHR